MYDLNMEGLCCIYPCHSAKQVIRIIRVMLILHIQEFYAITRSIRISSYMLPRFAFKSRMNRVCNTQTFLIYHCIDFNQKKHMYICPCVTKKNTPRRILAIILTNFTPKSNKPNPEFRDKIFK